MYVSHDRRSAVTANTCQAGVVAGGWLLTMAAVAAFAFTTGDSVLDSDDTILSGQSVAAYHQSLSATGSALSADRTSPRIVQTDAHGTAKPAHRTSTAAPSGGTCDPRPVTSITGSVQRVSARELASRSTHTRGGASISRIAASACRVGSAAKLNTAGISSPAPVRSAGAARPATTVPTAN